MLFACGGIEAQQDACQILKSKQSNLEQVVNTLGESEILIKALKELAKQQDGVFDLSSVADQIDVYSKTNKELLDLKKYLEMHVAALKLLCPITTTTTTTTANVALKTSIMSTQSLPNIPNIAEIKVSPPVSNPPVVANVTVVETKNELPYQMVEDAIIVGNQAIKDAPSGLYWIKPEQSKTKYIVHCEQKSNGGGWILISTRVRACTPKVVPIVKPLFNGDSISKDKWTYLRSSTKELMWQGKDGRYALADMSVLTTGGSGICKPLAMDATDPLMYHKEDSGCTQSGEDYCMLGVYASRTTEIFRLCKNPPFKYYGFKGSFDELYETNIFVR